MSKFYYVLLASFCFFTWEANALYAQKASITGTVTSTSGDTLPYASIFSATSGQGASSNEYGNFKLTLDPGKHEIIAQYVGYKKFREQLILQEGDRKVIDIVLEPVSLTLTEVTIKGDRNPADQIMRKVISLRPEFEDSSSIFEANVYIKGLYRLIDVPEKIFGMETGGMDSLMGQMRSNIIYLSETKSIFSKREERQKEKVLASKVSGFSSMPSLNSSETIHLNFYKNNLNVLGSYMKSPIADDAFQHYEYKLLGTYEDEEGRLINRIEILPKQKADPLLQGYIEIVDEQWIIRSLNLKTDGLRIKSGLIDSLHIRQNFYPFKEKRVWPIVQNEIAMKVSAFGFKAKGGFTGVYSDYVFSPDSFQLEIDRNILEYSEDALSRDSLFWLKERPIELSADEKRDYEVKDSIINVLQDSARLDSLEREANKLEPMDLLTKYEFNRRVKNINFSISSPFINALFNPVQGVNFTSTAEFTKSWSEKDSFLQFQSSASATYGLADRTVRYTGHLSLVKNEYDPFEISISAGRELLQINNDNPISLSANQFSNLFFKYHFIRFYDSRNVKLKINKEFRSGFSIFQTLVWERRSLVENNSQWSIFSQDILYPDNFPLHEDIEEMPSIYRENEIIKWKGILFYQPGITYMIFPNTRIKRASKLPRFTLRYDWGIPIGPSTSNYLFLEGQISYRQQMGIAGYSYWVVKGGGFIYKDELTFFDYKHFLGNEFFVSDANYIDDFLLLPYYEYSTDQAFGAVHWTHNFESYILNKIPVIRKLGFSLVVKGSYLHHRDIGHYNELSLGIDRLGWGLFRLLRLDVISSFKNANYHDWGLVLGTKVSFTDIQEMMN
jgi:hypothetical protein